MFSRFRPRRVTTTTDRVIHFSASKPDPERLLEEGIAFEQLQAFDQALRCYDEAILLLPTLARAHFGRGNIFLERGDAISAIQAYVVALQLKPDSAGTYFNLGNAHLILDQKEAAVTAYGRAIDLKPDFTAALAAMGKTLSDLGRHQEALAPLRHALAIEPTSVEVHFDLGNSLTHLQQFEAAANIYQDALKLNTDNVELHGNLGNVLHDLKRFDEAIASYNRLLELHPDDAKAHNNLGNVWRDLGRLEDAIASYRRAIEFQPNLAVAHYNLGVLYQKIGDMQHALTSYVNALAIAPDYAEALCNKAAIQGELGQFDVAMASCRRALKLRPDYAEGYVVLGNLYQDIGKGDDAMEAYRHALLINPLSAQAHNALGAALSLVGHLDDAVISFRTALEIEPNNADTHMNLGSALADLGHFDEAINSTEHALSLDPENAPALSNLLFIQNYLNSAPEDAMLHNAKRFGSLVAAKAHQCNTWTNAPDSERTIRIGLISADLRNHPVGYFLDGVIKAVSANQSSSIEIFAYPTRAFEDSISRRIQSCCSQWHLVVGYSDERLSERIKDDRIDILIDLSGHTAHNRLSLFAWKPAPVQVSWLGYFATTGVATIDYLIADPWTLPESEEQQFTEHIWRLPETRLCFTPPEMQLSVASLPALNNKYITFGCFNNLAKMNDSVVALWAQILNTVPNSRMMLMAAALKQASTRNNVIGRFAAHGISVERLILQGSVPRATYLAMYSQIDIALDPFPFTGGTTTAEALWMGVPVLTMSGQHFLSRQGVGLLANIGLHDWIASDAENYVCRAREFTRDLQSLAALRKCLRQRALASPIYDSNRFARHLESALRDMWKIWCSTSNRPK